MDFEHSESIFNVNQVKNNIPQGTKIKLLNKVLLNFNKYLMNNNGARNYAIEIGKENGSEWS